MIRRRPLHHSFLIAMFAILMLGLVSAADWPTVADKVLLSLVTIESEGAHCTGFVIDRVRGHVLTAAHCYTNEKTIYADHAPAAVVSLDAKRDLLVLRIVDADRPALKLAAHNPRIGDAVASYGYGMALERPLFRTAIVSDDDTYIPTDNIGGPFVVIDAAFVGGQSGGPVVDQAGDVVMIVQRGTDRVGIGVGAATLQKQVGKYFSK